MGLCGFLVAAAWLKNIKKLWSLILGGLIGSTSITKVSLITFWVKEELYILPTSLGGRGLRIDKRQSEGHEC